MATPACAWQQPEGVMEVFMNAIEPAVLPNQKSSPPLRWTVFRDVHSTFAQEGVGVWADVVSLLTSDRAYPSKSACPLFKGATFGSERTAAGAIRSDTNMQMVWIIEGDYDGAEVSVDQAIEMLERHHIRALVVTTASHTPDTPRWRVLTPLAQPCGPVDRFHLVARLNGALGGILAPESFTASQSYFFGGIQGSIFKWALTFGDADEGSCIDELENLEQIDIGRRGGAQDVAQDCKGARAVDEAAVAQAVATLRRRLRTGDGRREILRSIAASQLARFCSYEQTMGKISRADAAG